MTDEAFEVYEVLWETLHNVIDLGIAGLTEDDDEAIREKLMNEFRFWRRKQ